ncbi:MAG: hypothetical protein NUV84_01105 [Candidatus Uhrbacteria bacterium]|nr:hypothetical protein [Candidatus Uhrbacteria bacterium]
MTTIINTPPSEGGSVVGLVIGLVVAAVVIALFFMYGLPAIRNMSQQQTEPTTIKVEIPDVTETPTQPQE